MAELMCNSRLLWYIIYLSKNDAKPLSLLPGCICDSGRNALKSISRCWPSDDGLHRILIWHWCRCLVAVSWWPGPSVVPSHPCACHPNWSLLASKYIGLVMQKSFPCHDVIRHICVGKFAYYCFSWCLFGYLAWSHYLNQCWPSINETMGSIFVFPFFQIQTFGNFI